MNEVSFTHRFAESSPSPRVHHLFEAQVRRTPGACAVTMAGRDALTYGELNARADGLASRLRDRGVGPEMIVGICLPRSPDAVVAVLAVLKAGGAYLPLDPAYPVERLDFMLENCGARVLITGEETGRMWPERVFVLRPGDAAPAGADPGGIVVPGSSREDADPLAYVIYTSGSTGRPKGVAMPHGPLVNLLRWQARTCPLPAGQRVLQFAPLSFDVSFQEIFSTLGEGGTLTLIPENVRRDPAELLRLLDEEQIGRIFLPPVMLAQVADRSVVGGILPRSLNEVITAGEALRLTPAVIRFFSAMWERGRGCALHNHYGPTETHVATACTLSGEPGNWSVLPSIGQPIDDVTVRIVDENGQSALAGEPGTLELGGACLARGYLHDPGLTRSKFIHDAAGARWYRTGDLAQELPGGELCFLGRADDQVKIRGFRIETGEVEAALAGHPDLRDAAVGTVQDEKAGTRELVACVVSRDPGTTLPPAALRGWLLGRLPEYMVPTRFATVDALPLTPSGKVDRRALGGLALAAVAGESPVLADPPRGAAEEVVARVWREVLGGREFGVRDNFFEVGGTSLHAMQVHTRLCQALRREFPITVIFQHPTIATLAAHLWAGDRSAGQSASIQERARRQQQQSAARIRLAPAHGKT